MKILIVEDDENIKRELKELLTNEGYDAVTLENFEKAKEEILRISPDLILLDINIPFINGELLLKEIRKELSTPIIMVTSRENVADEVLSMSYGADDYITKPYNPTVLLLRINAILKRMENYTGLINYEKSVINIKKGTVSLENKEIILTKNEMIIFTHLLNHRGEIVNRDELMTDLWDNDEYINDSALTVNISRLRAKLKELGLEDKLQTRKGQGYILL